MESKIPLPTDNIYKFYALFGLFLFVISVGATLYANRSTNQQIIRLLLEVESLKQEPALTGKQVLEKALLERQLEIASSDKKLFRNGLAFLAAASVLGMAYGFARWHRQVQPLADEAARVQLEIAKMQLHKQRVSEGASDIGAALGKKVS